MPCAYLFRALLAVCLVFAGGCARANAAPCDQAPSDGCYFALTPAGAQGQLHYYASRTPATSGAPAFGASAAAARAPVQALIALHGHPRDAGKTFQAALLAVSRASALARTLVVAPLFQVGADEAGRCQSPGVPAAQEGDLLWTCQSWVDGGAARRGGGITSYAALDALVAEMQRQWPGLQRITIAGFSAGAQMLQHYIGFAAPPAGSARLRYVVADPGSWLYFDAVRPQFMLQGQPVDGSVCKGGPDLAGGCSVELVPADTAACPDAHRWKYGVQALPAHLGRDAAAARAAYAAADISYLEGALDSSDAPGAFYKILDKSCAAQAQGPYRLQRGLAFAHYDRTLLAPATQRPLVIVPGCAHDVACVFTSQAARAALFGERP